MGTKEFFTFIKDHEGRKIPEYINLMLFFNNLSKEAIKSYIEYGILTTAVIGNFTIVKINSTWEVSKENIMNKDKKTILPKWVDQITILGNDSFLINDRNSFSLIDQKGHLKWSGMKRQYFSEGIKRTIIINKNGETNMTDDDGNILCPVWLSDIRLLLYKGKYSDMIVIENKRRINLMTRNGEILYDDWFVGIVDSISTLGEELYFRVKKDGKFNYINKMDGSLLVTEWFDKIGEYYGEGYVFGDYVYTYGVIGDTSYRINVANGKMERTEIPDKTQYVK